jgi:hypothetical protein
MDDSASANSNNSDSYSSLPEPEQLKVSLLIDFLYGDTQHEIICTSCTVRQLPCFKTGRTIEWLHCKATPSFEAKYGSSISTMTVLIPCEYVTRARPGPAFEIKTAVPTVDIGVFAADQPIPPKQLPDFEIHRALTYCRGLLVPEPLSGRMYNDFIGKISNEFASQIGKIEAEHNFELGDEFELALCKVLRLFLPQKYGICRGYVVNSRGDKRGNDIIIFDRMRFPTIRGLIAEDYSQMENVPIEAVYAYIEAKHTLNIQGDDGSSLANALKQVSLAKLLCVQRREVALNEIAPFVAINDTAVEPMEGWPDHRNPIYGAVIARQVRLKKGEAILADPHKIKEAIAKSPIKCEIPPDLIIAGKDNLVFPGLPRDEAGVARTPSPFYLAKESSDSVILYPYQVSDVAFGAGLAFLMWALDWIQLADMPWPQILTNAILHNQDQKIP